MKKVLFVCEHLPNEGGIGPALLNQIESMDRKLYDISLCLVCNYVDKSVRIPEYVHLIKGSKMMEYHIVNYEKRKKEYGVFQRIIMLAMKQVRRKIGFQKYQELALKNFHLKEKYDVAIAYSNDICKNGIPISGGSNYFVTNCVEADSKVAWIHNEVEHQGFTHEYCLKAFKPYKFIVNVSESCKRLFDNMVPEYSSKSIYIYNIIDYEKIYKKAKACIPQVMNSPKLKIVTAARMEENQKRISRIIDCCDRMVACGIDNFIWIVLGDGPDYNKYVKMVNDKNLCKYIVFMGHQDNPYVFMKNADIFVLPSLYESFGLVLKEALAVGCPVVTTDFQASHEIVEDNVNGIICENSSDGIYKAISTIANNLEYLNKLKTNISKCKQNLNVIAKEQFNTMMEERNNGQ